MVKSQSWSTPPQEGFRQVRSDEAALSVIDAQDTLAHEMISRYGWMAGPDGQARPLGAGVASRSSKARKELRMDGGENRKLL